MTTKAPKAPDLTPQAQASENIARIQDQQFRDQLAWAKEQDAANRAVLERVLGVQLPIMEEQFKNAQADRERYEQTFQPIEDNLIREFQQYDSPERRELERGRAVADVNASFEAQRRNAEANLASYGVDPTTLKAGALDVGMRTAQAAAQASAADAATQRVENTGRALRAEAINIGKGMPSQVAQSYGQSVAAGQAGLGGANATSANSSALFGGATNAGTAAVGSYGAGANIRNSAFQNQMQAANFNAQNGLGAVATQLGGAAIGAFMEEGGIVTEHGALPVSPVPGSTDRKPAMLTPGEFVVPDDVVRFKGEEFFHKLMQKSREQRAAIPMG